MAAAGLGAFASVWLEKSTWYRKLAYAIGGLGVLQILSGATLSFFTSTSVLVVCSKLFMYLSMTVAFEVLLIRKMAAAAEPNTEEQIANAID